MHTPLKFGLALTLLFLPLALFAADWPQWRGPDRTGVSQEKGLLKEWPKGGPKLLWTYKDAGTGFTAPAVIGDVVYTMGARNGDEYLIVLNGAGKEKWTTKIGPMFDFKTNQWSGGPNSTPTVEKDAIFALGSSGDLVCLSIDGKKVIWSKNLPKDFGGQVNPVAGGAPNMGWGYSWSPLVDGDNLIITPGGPNGLFAALNKKTGDLIWQSKDVKDQCTYASPIVADVKGVRQYITMVQDGCVGVDAKTGGLLWRYKRAAYREIVATTPIFKNDHVWTTGLGGCDLVELSANGNAFEAKKKAATGDLVIVHGGAVLVGNHIYGANSERSWKALDFQTCKAVWDSGRNGLPAGSVTCADEMLYIVGEKDGTVGLIEANPKAYTEKGSFNLPEQSKLRKVSGKVWTHPVVANGRLYLRDQELIFCYEVK